jgi:hypothetical protein
VEGGAFQSRGVRVPVYLSRSAKQQAKRLNTANNESRQGATATVLPAELIGLRRDELRMLNAIGKELGLTYERVRQIEKAALVTLRDVLAVRGITWDALL